MTLAQMLSAFRYRMEDPSGDKWDDSKIDEIYRIFNTAQNLAIEGLISIGKWHYLKELESSSNGTLSGGRFSFSHSGIFKVIVVRNNTNNDFINFSEVVPQKTSKSTFGRLDSLTEIAYHFDEYMYVEGGIDSTTYTVFFIQLPNEINSDLTNFSVGNYCQDVILAISEYIGWIIDNQLERAKSVAERIFLLYGIRVDKQES